MNNQFYTFISEANDELSQKKKDLKKVMKSGMSPDFKVNFKSIKLSKSDIDSIVKLYTKKSKVEVDSSQFGSSDIKLIFKSGYLSISRGRNKEFDVDLDNLLISGDIICTASFQLDDFEERVDNKDMSIVFDQIIVDKTDNLLTKLVTKLLDANNLTYKDVEVFEYWTTGHGEFNNLGFTLNIGCHLTDLDLKKIDFKPF